MNADALAALDKALADPGRPAGTVTLADVGGITLHLRRWTVADQQEARRLSADAGMDGGDRTAEYIRLCLADSEGRQLLQPGDDRAYKFPVTAAGAIIDATLEANGLLAAEQKKTPSATTPS
jgi:hypothetical protein